MPQSRSSSATGQAEEALRRLEARLERASSAAERLFSEAASEAAGRLKVPAQGWQAAGQKAREGGELELLLGTLGSLGELIPLDLRHRLAEAVKELLFALRALIDWYLERLERRAATPVEVEDIPVL